MLKNTIFSNSFVFRRFNVRENRQVDNTKGIDGNFVALMQRGEGRLVSEEGEVKISAGDVFFIPNGWKYRSFWRAEPKYDFISLCFHFMPNPEGRRYPAQVIASSEEERELVRKIYERGEPDAESIGMFYTLFASLQKKMKFNTGERGRELVIRAERLISLHPDLNVSELAKECAVSESTLYSAFKRYSERSMNEIKMTVLLNKAHGLLTETDLSVEEISERLGFCSSAYFRKCFSKRYGASPRTVRKTGGI